MVGRLTVANNYGFRPSMPTNDGVTRKRC